MKTILTAHGEIEIVNVRMKRTGYGQYNITVEYKYEEQDYKFSIHSTCSQLFDEQKEIGDQPWENATITSSDFLCDRLENQISKTIDDILANRSKQII